jgi:hypothetical protein
MLTHEPNQSRLIERHITTDYARGKVATAFFEVILDGLEYGPRDLPTAEDREWIRGAIAMPIQDATELALHDLARRLAKALERPPEALLARYDASPAGEEVGSE